MIKQKTGAEAPGFFSFCLETLRQILVDTDRTRGRKGENLKTTRLCVLERDIYETWNTPSEPAAKS
jgi:hypothetical protein